MISNTKRYNRTINMLKDGIRSFIRYDSIWCLTNFNKYITLKPEFYGYYTSLKFNVPIRRNIVCEQGSDGNIYIGPEFGEVLIDAYDEDDVRRFIANRAFSSYHRINYPNPELEKDMDLEYWEYEKDPELICKSTPYIKLIGALEDIKYSPNKRGIIREGEFPKLDNRNMIPVFILNINKGTIEFFQSNHPDTYRKNRKSIDIREVSVFTDKYISNVVCIPKSLIDVEIESEYLFNGK